MGEKETGSIQEHSREERVSAGDALISAAGGTVDEGAAPYKSFDPAQRERFYVLRGLRGGADVVFKIADPDGAEQLRTEVKNLRAIARAESRVERPLRIGFVRLQGEPFSDGTMEGIATEFAQDDQETRRKLGGEDKVRLVARAIEGIQRLPVDIADVRAAGIEELSAEKIIRDGSYFLSRLSELGALDAEVADLLSKRFERARPSLGAEPPVFVHGDTHGGNLFLQPGQSGDPDIRVIDLEALRVSNRYVDWANILNKHLAISTIQRERPELIEPILATVESIWLDASVPFDVDKTKDAICGNDPARREDFDMTRAYLMAEKMLASHTSKDPLLQESNKIFAVELERIARSG